MHSTMIIVNIIMSGLTVGAVTAVILIALRLSHGYPRRRGRADWRGPAAAPLIYNAASMATEVNSRAR